MPPRPGSKLVEAWTSPSFAEAVGTLAKARGESVSDVIRRALQSELLDRARERVGEAAEGNGQG